tara:strand:- start:522 stop:782 length:261 start_codon:yes stop_codon:yes gene_type:complete
MTQTEIELLVETWQKLSNYVPVKDRLDAAKAFVILLDEYGLDDQAQQEFKDVDDYLADAIDEYYQDTDDDEDYSEDYGSESESDDY